MPTNETETTISAKELRDELRSVVEQVRRGRSFTVLYRSRPAFRIVPVHDITAQGRESLDTEPLYRAGPLVHSGDAELSDRHDEVLYGCEP